MDPSFGDQEKRFILAEMIKASHVNIEAVVNFVKNLNIAPEWHDMQVPHGRTVNQCKQVAYSMGIDASPPNASQHQQLHYQQPGQQYPAQQLQHHQQHHRQLPEHQPHQQVEQHQRPQQQHPLPLPATKRKQSSGSGEPVHKRLAAAPLESHAVSQPRNIRPRPPENGLPLASPVPATTPYKPTKKRGRPSRADKEDRARATASYSFTRIQPAARPILPNEPSSSPAIMSSVPHKASEEPRQSLDESPRLTEQPGLRRLQPKISPASPASDEVPPEPRETRSPKSPTPASLPSSSRVSVSDLIKTNAPAVVTTGV